MRKAGRWFYEQGLGLLAWAVILWWGWQHWGLVVWGVLFGIYLLSLVWLRRHRRTWANREAAIALRHKTNKLKRLDRGRWEPALWSAEDEEHARRMERDLRAGRTPSLGDKADHARVRAEWRQG